MAPIVLEPDQWQQRQHAHQARVDDLVAGHRARQQAGIAHPVEDFLFTYYFLRPARMRRWHPGPGVVLAGAVPAQIGPEYVAAPGTTPTSATPTSATPTGATLDTASVLRRKHATVTHIRRLLAATASRPAQFGCFGIHEWAMVYQLSRAEMRHRILPLRHTVETTNAVLETLPVRCTHFDAFRFFTPAARPRNQVQPTRDTQHQYEQPGCLHANMDLYRHAYKLSPLIPGELLVDCFDLARDIRVLDMAASPYDVTSLGIAAVCVETADGRAEYAAAQKEFSERAAPLRAALLAHCDSLIDERLDS